MLVIAFILFSCIFVYYICLFVYFHLYISCCCKVVGTLFEINWLYSWLFCSAAFSLTKAKQIRDKYNASKLANFKSVDNSNISLWKANWPSQISTQTKNTRLDKSWLKQWFVAVETEWKTEKYKHAMCRHWSSKTGGIAGSKEQWQWHWRQLWAVVGVEWDKGTATTSSLQSSLQLYYCFSKPTNAKWAKSSPNTLLLNLTQVLVSCQPDQS